MVWLMVATVSMLIRFVDSNYPVFDAGSNMRHLLLPADTRIGSIVYRLRGSDPDKDYPLLFKATDYGSYVIRIESLPCNGTSSHCAANVYLERSVSPGQLFKFRMTVRDTQGDTTTVAVTIEVTDATSDINTVFPHIPGVIMVPEDTKVNTELEYVIVRKNPRNTKPAKLELWKETNGSFLEPSRQFQLTQTTTKERTTGTIRLGLPLDYEQKTMYKLSVFATDMYAVPGEDSRNIAGFQLVIVIVDVQDTPPVWDHIAPITRLPINLTEGDTVLKVTARDGDKGTPRQIKYGLVSEGNPFIVFFTIGIETGEIRLVRPLRELTAISRSHQPILLTVVAEEIVKPGENPPAMSSEATVALLLDEVGNVPPYFQSPNYVSRIEENSQQGTTLVFDDPYFTEIRDDDMGKHGVFKLSLENNNGTFEISPTVAERRAYFVIRVRDNSMLDYEERKVVSFAIEAKEVATDIIPLSSSVTVTVYITDINDNPPVFSQEEYTTKMPENVTMGVHVVTVAATDVDTDLAGTVRYTAILGHLNASLILNPKSGDISVATNSHGFDREQASEYRFYIEARDEDGMGNRATVPLVIEVLDVNDEKPVFLQNPMDFILASDGLNFSDRAFVKAVDNDAEPPNNIVQYEIVSGNYGNRFLLNSTSGELTVQPFDNARSARQTQSSESVTVLMVRAYDLGVPTQSSGGQVKIYPPESGARVMTFIVPGKNPDKKNIEDMLTVLTGGRVKIQEIHPYYGFNGPAQDLTHNLPDTDKSVVIATVLYNKNSTIDIEKLQQRFTTNNSETTLTVKEYTHENKILFWVLVLILILIALAILTLLFCCLCPCCPLYAIGRKRSRIHTAENIRFVVHNEEPGHENKGVQAEWIGSGHKEAWSADSYTRHRWHFNRRNIRRNETQRVILVAASAATQTRAESDLIRPQPQIHHHHHHQTRPSPVSVIYTNDVAQRQHQTDRIIMEDIDGTEYRVLDPSRLTLPRHDMRRDEDPDSDSMRRHEFERGSDVAPADQTTNQDENFTENAPRDQMFIRDGNAEILRLITRGRAVEEGEEPALNQPERPYTAEGKSEIKRHEEDGKEIIMKRFMEDQRKSADRQRDLKQKEETVNLAKETEHPKEDSEDLMQKIMDIPETNLSTTDVNRLTTLQRDLLLTRFLVEEQRRTLAAHVIGHDETQSLPGMTTSMATQTDVDRGTQTELLYTMRPPRRKAKSDIDDSGESEIEDNGEVRLRKLKKTRRKIDNGFEIQDSGRSMSRCEIKTPILEENESAIEAASEIMNKTKDGTQRMMLAKSSVEDHRTKHIGIKGIKRADSTGKIRSIETELTDSKDSALGGFANTKTSLLRLQTTRKRLKKDDDTIDEQTVPSSKRYTLSDSSEDELRDSKRKSVSELNLQHSYGSFSAGKTIHSSFKSLQPTPITKRKYTHVKDSEPPTDLDETERSKSSKHRQTSSKFDSSSGTLSRKSKINSFSEERINEQSKMHIRQKSASQPEIEKEDYIKKPVKSAPTKEVLNKENTYKTGTKPRYMEHYKKKREEREKQREEEKLKSMQPATKAKSVKQVKRQTPTSRDSKQEENKDLLRRDVKTPIEPRISQTSRSRIHQRDKDTDDSGKLQTHRSGRQSKPLQERHKHTEGLIQSERNIGTQNNILQSTPRDAAVSHGMRYSDLQNSEISEDSLQSSPRKPQSRTVNKESPSKSSNHILTSTSRRIAVDGDNLQLTPRRLENQKDSLPLASKRTEVQQESLKTKSNQFKGHEENVSQPNSRRMELREDVTQQRFEDDKDSGIAMSQMLTSSQKLKRKNQNLMEKKSVFTIAYDDMQTKQLRIDSASPP